MSQSAYTTAVLADSPVAFWKLDEASGLPQDSSGNSRHMTSDNGAATVTYAETGPFSGSSAIKFNGSSGHRHFRTASVISTNIDDITIEYWQKTIDSTSARSFYVGSSSTQISTSVSGYVYANNNPQQNVPEVAARVSKNSWSHVVHLRRSGTWESYYNGELYNSNQGTDAPAAATSNSALGLTSTSNVGSFNFTLSNVSFYNTALSAARIKAHYEAAMDIAQAPTNSYATEVLADTPAAYWKLDEASGLPQDSSGNGKHMTSTTGSPTYDAGIPFVGAKSIRFNPSSSVIAFNQNTGIVNAVNDWTLEAWINYVTGGTTVRVISSSTDSTNRHAVCVSSTDLIASDNPTGSRSSFKILGRSWTHVVLANDAGFVRLYINGELQEYGTFSTLGVNPSSQYVIGAKSNTGGNVTADLYLSNVALYNFLLSAARIKAHYQAAMQIKAQNRQILQPALTLR